MAKKSKKSMKKKAGYVLSEKELKREEQQEKDYIHEKQEDEKRTPTRIVGE